MKTFFKIYKVLGNTFKNILHDKVLLTLLALSFSIFSGFMIYNQNHFIASLIQPNEVLEESEFPALFTEYRDIRELDIRSISPGNYIVEFLATEGIGNSLHPFSFIVTKEYGTIINIQEMGDSSSVLKEDELDFIYEAIDVDPSSLGEPSL